MDRDSEFSYLGPEEMILTRNSAFKFAPVLGRYIADCFENKASDELRMRWRLRIPDGKGEIPKKGDGSRGGQPWRLLLPHEQAKL